MSVNFNPNLMAQVGQNNFQTQKVNFGGFKGGEQLGGGKKGSLAWH